MTELTVKEVAQQLGTHRNTVYKYISAGLLPAYKLGGNGKSRRHWHIKEEDLERFIQGK